MNAIDTLLEDLRSHTAYKILEEQIEDRAPIVPSWNPEEDIENWKYKSALREGYFLALSNFKISENKK